MKARVPLAGTPSKVVTVETEATIGAILGVNLKWPDGRLVVPADFQNPASQPVTGYPATYWRLVQEIPRNVNALAAIASQGLYTITGSGGSVTREIEATVGRTTVANGDGLAGNPVVDLAVVPDAGGGTLMRFARDGWGRVTGTSGATTDDLGEGAGNLYFTDTRAQGAVVVQSIEDGDLDHSPSGDLVYQATHFVAPGGVDRELRDKAVEQLSPQDFGAVGDGTADDTAALADAIASSDNLFLSGDFLVTTIGNDLGVPLRGRGRILKAITGGLQQLNSQADVCQAVFGQEYLYAFHSKLLAGVAASMLFSGDSTTQGGGTGASGEGLIHTAVLNLGRGRGHKLTATNAGHNGENTADWVSTYLAADLATNPDLYVVRWGINDPFDGRTLTQFATSLRAGLAQCRATKTLSQMAILLMTPNSTSDTPNGRDEKWYEQVTQVCRQAARDYQCAFIDTYFRWKDSRPAAGLWMDDPFGDGRAIHPKNLMNFWIATDIAAILFPEGLDPPRWGTYTPTLTNGANVASSTPSQCQWARRGNVVTVSGRVDISCTAAGNTLTILGMSLPVASDLTIAANLAGGGGIGQPTYQNFLCLGDAANNRATLQFLSNGTGSAAAFFSFTYLVQ